MADIIDQAMEEFEHHLNAAIANRAKPVPPSLICKNGDCGQPSLHGTRYCSCECREDHEKEVWSIKNRKISR
ncbi:hypothetical protein LLQ46_11650 [Rouxiella badensis]|jgi:hypothetical protein|uniref:hypothetical protein n=1 Tax=Rouxiella badensis TaxID=1646377 RepID=UPI0013EEF6D4|nr:hypothetical protein [Rouxiella badensis]MCC3703608.1 hypothetical protein [Rouxiella badensis]MCC3747503.1 hypothetical protein [Rouxiella badensis]QII39118.1 hypothetical protein G3M83_16175 [Rouxiella badensis]